MGLFDRLQKALRAPTTSAPRVAAPQTASETGSETARAVSPAPETAAGTPAAQPEMVTLFEQRVAGLTQDQWLLVEAQWRTTSTSVNRSAARASARQRAEALGGESGPPIEEAAPTGRAGILDDAVIALRARDHLTPVEFGALYGPFERFIPRASLVRDPNDSEPSADD
jgi:hypothetical protein